MIEETTVDNVGKRPKQCGEETETDGNFLSFPRQSVCSDIDCTDIKKHTKAIIYKAPNANRPFQAIHEIHIVMHDE